MLHKMKKTKSEKKHAEKNRPQKKNLTQYRPTQSFTQILNYFGKT